MSFRDRPAGPVVLLYLNIGFQFIFFCGYRNNVNGNALPFADNIRHGSTNAEHYIV